MRRKTTMRPSRSLHNQGMTDRMNAHTALAEKTASIELDGRVTPEFAQILSADALAFVAALHRRFESRRQDLLARRAERQRQFDAGAMPDFLPETKKIRESEWKVAPQPKDLL